MNKHKLKKLMSYIKKLLDEKNIPGHGFDHVLRVRNIARAISMKEKVDFEVLELAALLHDIGRTIRSHSQKKHALSSSKIAYTILKKFKFGPALIEKVCKVIRNHSKNIKPTSIEEKILQDADRLDMTGAVGIARFLYISGIENATIYDPLSTLRKHYKYPSKSTINFLIEKCCTLEKVMITKSGKLLARKRCKFIKNFVKEYINEWHGKN